MESIAIGGCIPRGRHSDCDAHAPGYDDFVSMRWDETWHRLRDWTMDQGPSERLAAQVLLADGFKRLDPSHPLGGPDGQRDASMERDGKIWIMAVTFSHDRISLAKLRTKMVSDYRGATKSVAYGMAFVTN